MKHRLNAYKKDDIKWVTYCEICGQEDNGLINLEGECPLTISRIGQKLRILTVEDIDNSKEIA